VTTVHELAIAQALLAKVERHAQGRRVAEIHLAIGRLSGVEAHLLTQAFSLLTPKTVAETAMLQITTPPTLIFCPRCQQESEVAANALRCPHCGEWRTELRSGDALQLQSLHLHDA
jgi:hydrogenase nickel incorporation protein HypA/HybF